ncbi:DUF2280 domain-containing protein [Parapusillimonas sp. JC17]
MATFSDTVRQFIVQAVTCYDAPQQVSNGVKEE